MLTQTSIYTLLLFSSAGIALIVARSAWLRRSVAGGMFLAYMMLASAAWSLMDGLTMTHQTLAEKTLWSQLSYLGILSLPVLFLQFALEYSYQDEWLTRRNKLYLWILPVLSFIIVMTNEFHHLIWQEVIWISPNSMLAYRYGAWFWVIVAYLYVFIVAATVSLLIAVIRNRNLYRRQALTLLFAVPLPVLANISYVFKLTPQGIDPTSIAFVVTGILLTWNIYHNQLFELAPVARDIVIESMIDGMVVLDTQHRVVDLNDSARLVITMAQGSDARHLLQLSDVLGKNFQQFLKEKFTFSQGELPAVITEVMINNAEQDYLFEVRVIHLKNDHGKLLGYLLTFHDITKRKQAEKALLPVSYTHLTLPTNREV